MNVALPVAGTLKELEPFDAAFVTTSSSLDSCMDTFLDLLGRGVNVVSSCEELAWPWLRHAEHAHRLDEAARAGGGRLLGTGVNPGFLMDALPILTSAVCNDVRHVEIGRVQDARPRRIPFQRKIGAGLDLEAFRAAEAAGTLRHVGLGESLHMVAATLGLAVDAWDEKLEPVIATDPLECALGTIEPGEASGVRQVARASSEGTERLRLVFQASIGEREPRDWVRIDGDPPVRLEIAGGVHGDRATIAVLINALVALQSAPPGLHTMASVPGVSYRELRGPSAIRSNPAARGSV